MKMPEELNLHIPKELENHKLYDKLISKKIREFEKILRGLENAKEPIMSEIENYRKLLFEIEELKRRD